MNKILIHQEKVSQLQGLEQLCPFNAISVIDGRIQISDGCRLCMMCVKNGPEGAFEYVKGQAKAIDKDEWSGIAVYVDSAEGKIHPVTFELIGKAREMAKKVRQSVYCVFIGKGILDNAKELLKYGVDEVFVYDHEAFEHFRIEPYTAAFEHFTKHVKPAVVLVGGTTIGRSLAPRMAARLKTGLTADCTVLDINENSDLDQIRPAFGGNIMAHIHTPNHRPQFATVRYKVFPAPEKSENATGKITICKIDPEGLNSNIKVIELKKKEKVVSLEDAEVIVVAGRGIRKSNDLEMIYQLADLLGAQVAGTRNLIEAGWIDARRQIGLSGRTVKPRLIITCGVSGAIQFVAGMSNSDCIIAINNDAKASIFNVAHYGIVGDIYEIVPKLIEIMRR